MGTGTPKEQVETLATPVKETQKWLGLGFHRRVVLENLV
jgi:hypothetical protein